MDLREFGIARKRGELLSWRSSVGRIGKLGEIVEHCRQTPEIRGLPHFFLPQHLAAGLALGKPKPTHSYPVKTAEKIRRLCMTKILAIAIGGALGALARYGVCIGAQKLLGERFAWGVLLANVVGCFCIGLLMHETLRSGPQPLNQSLHAGLTIGLLGALTTFSTFGYDTLGHWQAGDWKLAVANVFANLAVGLTAVVVGQRLGDWLFATSA